MSVLERDHEHKTPTAEYLQLMQQCSGRGCGVTLFTYWARSREELHQIAEHLRPVYCMQCEPKPRCVTVTDAEERAVTLNLRTFEGVRWQDNGAVVFYTGWSVQVPGDEDQRRLRAALGYEPGDDTHCPHEDYETTPAPEPWRAPVERAYAAISDSLDRRDFCISHSLRCVLQAVARDLATALDGTGMVAGDDDAS